MRFCTSCQTPRAEHEGEMQRRGTVMRWICRPCLDRKSLSPYKSTGKSPYREPMRK